nr:substrate-binding domain-containing protein [Rhodanobacter glycinis]
MQPLLARWARGFQSRQPGVVVEVGRGTRYSAAGVAALLAGTANCISFAREAFPAEVAAFRHELGHEPILVPVAGGSFATPHGSFVLAVYVNRANPLRGLSLPQLAKLFSGRRLPGQMQPLTTWGQLGLHGVWADRPIHLYGMTPRRAGGNPPGIVNFLDTRVLQGRPWRADLRVQVDNLTADGAVRIVGYNDMRWMLQAIDRRYMQRYPGVRFRLILHGTRTAPAALASGRSLLAPMGAPFLPTALAAYRRQVGTGPLRFRVAHAALDPRARSSPLAIYVNIGNPLSSIDMEQLRRSFTGIEPLATWSQLGLGGTWARRPIHPCGLAPTTALGRYMRLQHFGGTAYAANYIGYAESAQVLARVAADPDALCIADLNQAVASVRMLGIRLGQGQGISIGSSADIVSGRYPLDRYLYIYVRAPKAGVSERMVCRYLRLLLSDDGQRLLAAAAPDYLPLS